MQQKNITAVGIASAAVIVLIVALAFANMRDSIFGAPFRVSVAENGTTVSTSFLPISGSAKHARDILINGRSIALDRSGNFSDAVILSPGYNTIAVSLKDQFGKEKMQTYQFVYVPENAVAQRQPVRLQQ